MLHALFRLSAGSERADQRAKAQCPRLDLTGHIGKTI
jgi:hypothetical protein